MNTVLQIIESIGSVATVVTLWITLQRFKKDASEKESETLELAMNRFFSAADVRELLKIRDPNLAATEMDQLVSIVVLLYRLRDLNQKIRASVHYDEENADLKSRQDMVAELLSALSPERLNFLKSNYPDVAFLIDELHPDNAEAMETSTEIFDSSVKNVEVADRAENEPKRAETQKNWRGQRHALKAAEDVRQLFLDAGVSAERFERALWQNQILIVKLTGAEKNTLGDWRISPNRAQHIHFIVGLENVDTFHDLYAVDERRKFDILPSGRIAFRGEKLDVPAGRELTSLANWDATNPVLYYKVWALHQSDAFKGAVDYWKGLEQKSVND
ncbi:hypothetical protein ACFO26_07555 [Lactococcus nasutitermitis]|uniref:Uncharacterized protein n=1 Tax=Lactococcus nasutitermitis TaxID=1652957 RepID=A0ABV9JFN3_9LACT|nr:hypothetical protein [Lactococcus nasutitermitis]